MGGGGGLEYEKGGRQFWVCGVQVDLKTKQWSGSQDCKMVGICKQCFDAYLEVSFVLEGMATDGEFTQCPFFLPITTFCNVIRLFYHAQSEKEKKLKKANKLSIIGKIP